MKNKIEVFSVGSGIWIAEVFINEENYAVVSTEAPEFFVVYQKVDDDQYLPEDIIFEKRREDLPPHLKPIYEDLLVALIKKQ